MNRETRQFILGLILGGIGFVALAINTIAIEKGEFGGWDYAFIVGNAYIAFIGAKLIKESIE